MRTLRALSTLLVTASFAAFCASACSKNGDDESLGAGATGGKGAGATGGTAVISPTGGSAGSGTGGTGGMDAGTAAAGGDDGILSCGQLDGLGTCGGTHLAAKLRTVNMLLVIDKSGSMDYQPTGFDQKKWPAMKSALATALEKVETQINFGLLLFPYDPAVPIALECDTNCCTVPPLKDAVQVDIAPGTVSVAQIEKQLATTDAGGGTPTAAALAAALDYFTSGAGAQLDGDNYVLLATDGGPDCNSALDCDKDTCTTNLDGACDSGNCCDDADTRISCLDDKSVTTELDALTAHGISTFVVGIPGTEAYAPYLDSFAQSGGVPASDGDSAYYAVSADMGVAGLVSVFDTITTELLHSCDITLPDAPDSLDLVNVAVDCDVIPQNTDAKKSGWDFDVTPDPTSVILHGPVCDALQVNGAERVDVVFGCPTVR